MKASIDLTDPWNNVNGAAIAPSGTDVYASSSAGYIWRLDPETLAIRASAALPGVIQDIAVTVTNLTGSTFTGNWSWAPYLFTLVACGAVAAIAARAITANRKKEQA